MAKIRLYTYSTSPYGMKVACILKFKGLDFEWVPVNPITNRQIAFTRQRQVPVLRIGKEWRKDSSPLGIWLDELYPSPPLLGGDGQERTKILEVDRWVSDSLFPAVFRVATDWSNWNRAIKTGWRLADILNEDVALPLPVRLSWPLIIKNVPFITRMVKPLEHEPLQDMNRRLCSEFLQRLDRGPFLAGQNQVSLADLSAFTAIYSGDLFGLGAVSDFTQNPEVNAWAIRVYKHLPTNPFLAADKFLTAHNSLATAVA